MPRAKMMLMKKLKAVLLGLLALTIMCGCSETKTSLQYEYADVHPVVGRQGLLKESKTETRISLKGVNVPG